MTWGRLRRGAGRRRDDVTSCPVSALPELPALVMTRPESSPCTQEPGAVNNGSADEVLVRRVQFFTMPGCPACVSVEAALERLCAEQPELRVERIDLSEQPQAALQYGIMACPAVALEGVLIAVGNVDVNRLRKLVGRTPLSPDRASGTCEGEPELAPQARP